MSDNSLNSPGVFRGHARLATQQDLCNLKRYFECIIAGPSGVVSENGYIPWIYNADGSLDIDSLFPELLNRLVENTGVAVSKNGVKIANNITSFNFQGKFVSVDIDENGCLSLTIDEPQKTIPNFNEATEFGDGLVKIENDVVEDMIVSDVSAVSDSLFGNWTPGTVVKGINWNNDYLADYLHIVTNGAVYASSLSTYFEILVTNSIGDVERFVSVPITGNTENGARLGASSLETSSHHINVYISDFKKESRGYSFVPTIDINLIKLLGTNGGRFNVKIIHHDAVDYAYQSDDMFYNCGTIPSITSTSVQVSNDSSVSSQIIGKYCSGIKYAKSGEVIIKLNRVNDLNNFTAVENPISCTIDIAEPDSISIIPDNYGLAYDAVANFMIKFRVKKNVISNEIGKARVKVRNGAGESAEYVIDVPVLINSIEDRSSNELNEYFIDETYRISYDCSSDELDWNSMQSLIQYDDGRGLMVVPGKGLQYPYGNWNEYIPEGSPNYNSVAFLSNEKYYARIFYGNSKTKFGGVFVIDGLTKDEFLDDRLSMIISCDKGMRWFNLKQFRNMDSMIIKDDGYAISAVGVLTCIKEKNGKLYVEWSYPVDIASNQSIYLKIGMKPTSNFVIKSISLLNTNEGEDW